MSPPSLGQNLSTPGSSSTAVPLGDFGPKPYGRIYSLHPGCHIFGNTRLRLSSIGFFITETPSTGVSSVASMTKGAQKDELSPPFVAAPVVARGTFYHSERDRIYVVVTFRVRRFARGRGSLGIVFVVFRNRLRKTPSPDDGLDVRVSFGKSRRIFGRQGIRYV